MIPENNRLQRIFFIFIGLILTCRTFGMDICDKVDEDKNYIDLVNPFVDSHRSRWFFFSSACRPFGMVSLSPDTDTEHSWGSGYLYGSKQIRCFSHVHNWQMSGVAVMPTVGEFKGHLGMNAYQSAFTHDGEIAKPGYHKVRLTDYDITAELTSTMRVGFHCYTFPKSDSSYILFDTGAFLAHGPTAYSEVWKVSDKEIAGWEIMERTGRRPKDTPVYFYAQLSKPMDEIVSWREGRLEPDSNPERISGKNAGMAVRFKTRNDEKVMLKVAISYVSVERAMFRTGCKDMEVLKQMAKVMKRLDTVVKEEFGKAGLCGYREYENWVYEYMRTQNLVKAAEDTVLSKLASDEEDRDMLRQVCMEIYVEQGKGSV